MGLLDSLQIGTSGLLAQQAAIQVTGNNIANAATDGYVRQAPVLTPTGESRFGRGVQSGGGVELSAVRRMVDAALQGRIYDAQARTSQYAVADQTLSRVESLMNEMTDTDLSTALNELFNSFGELAQSPRDAAVRGIVLQRAGTLVDQINYTRTSMEDLRLSLTEQLEGAVVDADRLADQIAELNTKIVTSESNGSTAASLRDQRDAVLSELSELVSVKVYETDAGAANVFIGSEPLVFDGVSRGLKLTQQEVNDQLEMVVTFADNDGAIKLLGGKITGLQGTRDNELASIISTFDNLASELIWQVNRLHSSGSSLAGLTDITGTYEVADADAALNSEDAGLDFTPVNGSFLVSVTNSLTGAIETSRIDVQLNGSAGDTTLNDLVADLNAVTGIQASVDPAGRVCIQIVDANTRIDFSEDSSGALAALGVNTFFSGHDANTIALNSSLAGNGSLIAAGVLGQPGYGGTAVALADLADQPQETLNNLSFTQYHQQLVARVAVLSAGARDSAEASLLVNESLVSQHQSLSGVSMDEEAVNLIRYQRAFQGSAKFISIVNELLDTLLSLA